MFLQNVIAVVWDFDKTLSPHYMQKPLFDAYGIDEDAFWKEVNALPEYYKRAGITVQRDTCYLGHLLSYVKCGRLAGLSNARLREVGERLEFYCGIPELFERLRALLQDPRYAESDLRLEHYVVSTGLAEMIRGSRIAPYLAGIYASEFIEEPAGPDTDLSGVPKQGPISQIAGFLDNTTKTRALFEINKGVNKVDSISVNDTIPEDERRVPFKNMIYIADGPSDIPSFSVVQKHGGKTCAVYDPGSKTSFAQALSLQENGRVGFIGEADYSEGHATFMWLSRQITRMADRMVSERKNTFQSKVGKGPTHLPDEG
ncbi:MAG: haloacid dehalogenase-like hydrolase [Candidatus Hydrogenedentes bacterium]|nr:haloacid dehalogenase-like hydrolase [Candidatus Hydrogenedentota bacterium]